MATPKEPRFGGNQYPPKNRQQPSFNEEDVKKFLKEFHKDNQSSNEMGQPKQTNDNQPSYEIKRDKKARFGGNQEPKKKGFLDFFFGNND